MASLKQKRVLDELTKNPSLTMKQAMINAGYAPITAHAPKRNLTSIKSFIDLLEEHGIDDVTLAKKHRELLNSEDNIAIKALDMGYKLKGHYAPDKVLNINASIKNFDKYTSVAQKYEDELLANMQEDSA